MFHRRHLLVAFVATATGACQIDLGNFESEDPRTGILGRVRFGGNEGCSGNTKMAVGSRAELTLESLGPVPLPDDLTVTTSDPEVLEAQTDEGTVTVVARTEGRSFLQVLDGGRLFDALALTAQPAVAADHLVEPRVFAGGTVDLLVTQVYGACGEDRCPLFGHSFLDWRSEPEGAFSLVTDDQGVARLRATATGTIIGQEPVRGADLVETPVEVIPVTDLTSLSARIIVLSDGDPSQDASFALPGSVRRGATFGLRLDGEVTGGPAVPLSKQDVAWTIDGPVSAVADHEAGLMFDVFAADGPGTVTLTAETPIFAERPSFELVIE